MSNGGHSREQTGVDPALPSSNRRFGWILVAFFLIVALFPLVSGHTPRIWALIVAAGFLAVSILAPLGLSPLLWLWMRFGALMHRIMSPVMLGLIFYVAVVPTGLIMRAFGKRPLNLAFDKAAPSYWIVRDPAGPPPESMKNQF
jgi:hypothetical protein